MIRLILRALAPLRTVAGAALTMLAPSKPPEPLAEADSYLAYYAECVQFAADQRQNLYEQADFDEWALESGWIS